MWHTATATHCNTLQHTATHTATHCNPLQHTTTHDNHTISSPIQVGSLLNLLRRTLKHPTTHCNTLQHAATRCNTLQHTTTHDNTQSALRFNFARYSIYYAGHCNTLQHTATHDNTWQHTISSLLNLLRSILKHTATHNNTRPTLHSIYLSTQFTTMCSTSRVLTPENLYQTLLTRLNLLRNTLQHTAIHRDTLQDTAQYENTQSALHDIYYTSKNYSADSWHFWFDQSKLQNAVKSPLTLALHSM